MEGLYDRNNKLFVNRSCSVGCSPCRGLSNSDIDFRNTFDQFQETVSKFCQQTYYGHIYIGFISKQFTEVNIGITEISVNTTDPRIFCVLLSLV